MIEIYCFSGKLGSGKNFVSEKIFLPMLEPKNTLCVALADHFKVEAIVKDGLEYEKVFGDKDEYTRKKLQLRGTEEGRNIYGENIWIDILKNWIKLYESRGIERFIISDIRFPNELKLFKEMGAKVFRINAPQRNLKRLQEEALKNNTTVESIANHISETALDNFIYDEMFDYIINNDEFDNSVRVIRDILNKDFNKAEFKTTVFCDLDDTIVYCNKYYLDTIDKVKNLLRGAYTNQQYNLKFIEDVFSERIYQHNTGSYFLTHFTKTKFAESLVQSIKEVNDMFPLDTEQQYQELAQIVYNFGMNVFNYKYEPINGAIETVKKLNKHYNLVIFTVGDRREQMKKLMEIGLFGYNVEIFDHKDETIFRYMMQKYKSKHYIMIGDSYERDIKPALNSGINDILHISEKTINPDKNIGYVRVSNLSEAYDTIVNNYQKVTL